MIRAPKTNGMSGIVVEGWPKIGRILAIAGLAAVLANGTVACMSTGEEGKDEEVVDEDGGKNEAAVAEDGGDKAAADSGAVAEEAPVTADATASNAAGPGGANAMAPESLPPVDAGAAPNAATAATEAAAATPEATAATGTPAAPASPAAAGPGITAGTKAVVYAGARATVYDAPNGKEIGRMARGDYVLATSEGEWVKTTDGHYVRAAELQLAPVGRKKVQSRWRSPRAH